MIFHPGRLVPPDFEHLDKYPLRTVEVPLPPVPTDAVWSIDCPILYDQGQTPKCVGYGTATLESALEAQNDPTWGKQSYNANSAYTWANSHDGLPRPHQGSTTRAGFEYLRQVGAKLASGAKRVSGEPYAHKISTYRWTTNVNDLISAMFSLKCPGMIGINWYRNMFDIDPNGFLSVSGPLDGGHNICVRGFDMPNELAIVRNSWGPWGINNTGDAKIHLVDLERLLNEQGEAGVVVDLLT